METLSTSREASWGMQAIHGGQHLPQMLHIHSTHLQNRKSYQEQDPKGNSLCLLKSIRGVGGYINLKLMLVRFCFSSGGYYIWKKVLTDFQALLCFHVNISCTFCCGKLDFCIIYFRFLYVLFFSNKKRNIHGILTIWQIGHLINIFTQSAI